MKQELDKGRRVDKTKYITVEWLKEKFIDKQLFHCKKILEPKEITAGRLDNKLAHHINNFVPSCLTCNLKKIQY